MDGGDRTGDQQQNVGRPPPAAQTGDLRHRPNPALAVAFLTALVVQGVHQAEYLVQLFERFVLEAPEVKGILGHFFDLDLLHFAYNLLFFWTLFLVYRLSGAHQPDRWERGMPSWWLLSIGLALQGYHLVEQVIRVWQLIDFGRADSSGISGLWLFFFLSTLTYALIVAAFWLGGFQRRLAADLRIVWSEIIVRPAERSPSDGSPRVSRRTLMLGSAGIIAAVGAARFTISERSPTQALPTFSDVTKQAGITFRHKSHRRLDAIQAGAAFFDYNGDGKPDIFLTNANGSNALYRNNGDGTFTDVTEEAGVADPDAISVGVACADYNNNGNCDLLVTTRTGLKLYQNNGDGTFTDVTKPALLNIEEGHPTSAAWGDFDGDGKLDLYIAYWFDNMPVQVNIDASPTGNESFYRPLARRHKLFRNNGDGTFRNISSSLRPDDLHGAGLAVGFFDYDDDGRLDLYVVNDFGQHVQPNILYRNEGPGSDGWTFNDVTEKAGVGAAIHGMGLAVGDFDEDGRLDMYMSNIGSSILYHNRGDGTFEEMTNRAEVGRGTIEGEKSIGWGTAFLDFDNNGLLDLYLVAGTLYPEKMDDGRYPPDQPNALFLNRGDGTFRDVSKITQSDHTGCGRGLAVADYDGDGFLDLLVANMDQHPVLLRNSGNGGHWLQVQLVGTRSNRDGIGARLVLEAGGRKQIREIQSGTSFLGQNSLVAHFGLADSGSVERLLVRWPSGVSQRLTNLQINQKITVTEPVE